MTIKQPPLCRYCGGKIAKATRTVYFGASGFIEKRPDRPTNRAEAQRLVNDGQVISISRDHTGREIRSANVWDGESYVSEYFCNGTHAKDFAHVFAIAGHGTRAYFRAIAARAPAGDRLKAAGR